MRRSRHGASAAVALAALIPAAARAGAFLFATGGAPAVVVHPTGYTGTGGTATVTVCVDPASPNAAAMEVAVRNVAATWTALAATTGNLRLGANNDVPAGTIDFESVALHEVGHCIGLAHPNLATESGLGEPDRNFTKAAPGPNGVYDLGIGADGVRGSSDDARGDDVNLHWFRRADNDPFVVGPVADTTTYALLPAELPPGHTAVANADRTVGALLGAPNTEAVMQQGSFTDEDQRRLAGDDVGTARLAAAGLDGRQGTADDYALDVRYVGRTTACDIVLAFNDAETGFASCHASGTYLTATHARVTSGRVYFNTGFAWHFNQTLAGPTATSTTTSTSTSSSTTIPATSTSTTSTTSSSTSSTSTTPTSTTSTSAPVAPSTSTTATSTSTSTTASTVAAPGCAPAPAGGCVPAARGVLHVREAAAGHERLLVVMKAFPDPGGFGDPSGGRTAYDLCLYDGHGAPAAALAVDRAGDRCGPRGRPCWRQVAGGAGLKYADPDLAAAGVRRVLLRSERIVVLAKNAAQRGRLAMPTGVAAALADTGGATAQLRVRGGACVELRASDVRVASPVVFRAVAD